VQSGERLLTFGLYVVSSVVARQQACCMCLKGSCHTVVDKFGATSDVLYSGVDGDDDHAIIE
jgi:hypothetical protein